MLTSRPDPRHRTARRRAVPDRPRPVPSPQSPPPPTVAPPPLTVAQVRAVDEICLERFGLPGAVLMENAARGCAELLLELAGGSPGAVAVLCGRGNNGGDGFALARHLTIAGAAAHLFAPFPEPPAEEDAGSSGQGGEAAMNARVARRMGLPWTDWTDLEEAELADRLAAAVGSGGWLVDALLGTGVRSAPRPPTAAAVAALNAAAARGAKVLALDLPTGLDADAGAPFDPGRCVRATHTATFVAPKAGFAAAERWTGTVRVVGIGCPPAAIETARAR